MSQTRTTRLHDQTTLPPDPAHVLANPPHIKHGYLTSRSVWFAVKAVLFVGFVICLTAALGGSIALGGAIGFGLTFIAALDEDNKEMR